MANKPVEETVETDVDRMGQLHNRFVAYISESEMPLPEVILVLTMLLNEATELARLKYLGK